jgi:MoaA/NifB/PqqE/SkfB family radical SAM enzyme
MMKEFLPWSKSTYTDSIKKYLDGHFSIIDVQVSGKCNFNCVYCDSPDRNIPAVIDYVHLSQLIRKEESVYDWIFVCGLGEPLYGENKTILMLLLKLCKELGLKCTIFTNGSGIDANILSYVEQGILFPLIKIDTFSLELAIELYGSKNAKKTLNVINELFEIVRTSKNITEIPTIVERCLENNTFPLIGQLEYAGKAINGYDQLLVSREQLLDLKRDIDSIIGERYVVPICPSVIAGIHIASSGYVTVDKRSGLSCSWFWLETPDTVNLCEVNKIDSLHVAERLILEHRKSILPGLYSMAGQIVEHPFGGCGGNIKDLFSDYIKIQSSIT